MVRGGAEESDKMKDIFLTTVLLAVLYGVPQTEAYFEDAKWSIPWDVVDDHVFDIIDNWGYEGATLGIMKEGQMVYAQAYGTVDAHNAHPNSLLPISAISKTITAVATLKLVEDGFLRLDSKVFGPGAVLHMIPLEKGKYDRRIPDITVEHLLRHTAGWDENVGPVYDPMLNPIYVHRGFNCVDIAKVMQVDGILNQNDIIRFMINQPLQSTPGKRIVVSNLGYSILGRVIEEITDLPYEDYVRESILLPSGMWRTRIGPNPGSDNRVSQVIDFTATLYQAVDFEDDRSDKKNDKMPSLMGEAGEHIYSVVNPEVLDSTLGWYSNVFDLSRFFASLDRLLSPATVRFMLRRPSVPEPRFEDAWEGIGFRVYDDGTIFRQNDHHGNDVILYHHGLFKALTADLDKGDYAPSPDKKNDITVVMLMTGNQWVKLERKVERILDDIQEWPTAENSFLYDLADFQVHAIKNHRNTIVNYQLDEHHFHGYINALRMAGYIARWVHGYKHGHHTAFVVIAEQAYYPEDLHYIIEVSSSDKKIVNLIADMTKEGYYVDDLQSYPSNSHDNKMGHVVILRQGDAQLFKVGVAEPLDSYFAELDKGSLRRYTPVVQSITTHRANVYATYLLEKTDDPDRRSTRSYHDLSTEELEASIKNNALDGYQLDFLDTWDDEGEPLFSAIFRKSTVTQKWVLQDDVRPENIGEEAYKWATFGYLPKFMVAYTEDNMQKYCAFWVLNQ